MIWIGIGDGSDTLANVIHREGQHEMCLHLARLEGGVCYQLSDDLGPIGMGTSTGATGCGFLDNMGADRLPFLFASADVSKEVFHLFLCLRHLLRGSIH